jgi:hypothetical protein
LPRSGVENAGPAALDAEDGRVHRVDEKLTERRDDEPVPRRGGTVQKAADQRGWRFEALTSGVWSPLAILDAEEARGSNPLAPTRKPRSEVVVGHDWVDQLKDRRNTVPIVAGELSLAGRLKIVAERHRSALVNRAMTTGA